MNAYLAEMDAGMLRMAHGFCLIRDLLWLHVFESLSQGRPLVFWDLACQFEANLQEHFFSPEI